MPRTDGFFLHDPADGFEKRCSVRSKKYRLRIVFAHTRQQGVNKFAGKEFALLAQTITLRVTCFFVAGEFNRNSTPSTNYPASGVSALTLDEAKQISERYYELTGYDGGGYGEHDINEITGAAVARLDWNINNDNHLSLRYNMLHADADSES